MRVNVVNIGCFKNLVDCELLIWQLRNSGVEVSFGQTDIYADIVIINTCGFISDAEKILWLRLTNMLSSSIKVL